MARSGTVFRRRELSALIAMLIRNDTLRRVDEAYLRALDSEELVQISLKLAADLKEARERLERTPSNSSLPPSSQAPWERAGRGAAPADDEGGDDAQADAVPGEDREAPEPAASATPEEAPAPRPEGAGEGEAAGRRRPGRQPGAPGHGRSERLAITDTEHHRVVRCEGCGRAAPGHGQRAWTGFYTLDLVLGDAARPGLAVTHVKHLYYELACGCGQRTRAAPHRTAADALWAGVALTEWRLIGPTLAALVVALSYRARMSRSQVREFLADWLGVRLSVGALQRCLLEAARASDALEEQLVESVLAAPLLHADETPHPEHGRALWLWVFVSASTVLFYIGDRSKEVVANLLGDDYAGWLMSDGYGVYREHVRRLRCWAHLLRKARGLEESFEAQACAFGREARALLERLMRAVYAARETPPGEALEVRYAAELAAFAECCERAQGSSHAKTRALAVELLRDWAAIFAVLAHPELPLTNNEAERMLRHWVLWRRISHGTRTAVGSRAFALLASVIETCRRRAHAPWPYLAAVIAAARDGRALPRLAPAQGP